MPVVREKLKYVPPTCGATTWRLDAKQQKDYKEKEMQEDFTPELILDTISKVDPQPSFSIKSATPAHKH